MGVTTVGRPKDEWQGRVVVGSEVPRRGYVEFRVTLDTDPDRVILIAIRNSKVEEFITNLRKLKKLELPTGEY